MLFAIRTWAVIPVPAGPLIQPAHYFDLNQRSLHFKPKGDGYVVSSSHSHPAGRLGDKLNHADYQFIRSWGYRRALPFSFRFAGKTWNEVFINGAGNLTFGHPEAELFPERDTWADGTMQTVGGSINDRAAAGQERMICALWGLYAPEDEKSQIFLRQNAKEFVVTWKVERYIWFGEAYRPLGPNFFQIHLQPDGSITFNYLQISEKDGIVGIFPGGFHGKTVATSRDKAVEVAIDGNTIRFTFEQVQEPKIHVYRVLLDQGLETCEIGIDLRDPPHGYFSQQCHGTSGYRITTKDHIELFATTHEMQNVLHPGVRWRASLLAENKEGTTELNPFPLDHLPEPARLSKLHGYGEGNIFEIFHYPHISKHPFILLRHIYQHAPADADFAVVFTDFRIDDLHNHQGTPTGYGPKIEGIGLADPYDATRVTASAKLQVVTGPAYLGPRFEQFLEDNDHHYKNYANAVGWVAHEWGHRWGMNLRFRNPKTGEAQDLADSSSHWNNLLNTRSMYPVWPLFADKPYAQKSQMEGNVWDQRSENTFVREDPKWNIAGGFSPLDLYAMGLIGPEEVPDTFLISRTPGDRGAEIHGDRIPVRIADVIAASGERVPNVRDSQKDFRIAVYLLYESGRPVDPAKLKQAQGIEDALLEYYHVATGGRMRVSASGAPLHDPPPPAHD